MYMINLVIIYVVVNRFSMKNHKSLRKLRVGVNRYTGVNWSTKFHKINNKCLDKLNLSIFCYLVQVTLSSCNFVAQTTFI